MLQIVDQALARMRTSGHAAVLAEMAVVRLAKLEDLESLSALVHAIPVEKGIAAAAPTRHAPAEREKKTTELTPTAPVAAPPADRTDREAVEQAAAAMSPAQPEAAPAAVVSVAAAPAVALPADPLAAWQQAGEAVGGIAADFAAMATRAVWRENLLEVGLPADATTAASFLRRPEVAAGIARVLAEIAGRPLKHTIVIEAVATRAAATGVPANGAVGADRHEPAAEKPRPAHSQAALLREAMEHPLVMHARTLFDAAVRKVEPPRRQEVAVTAEMPGAGDTELPDDRAAEHQGATDG
jgi:hypothetical protein